MNYIAVTMGDPAGIGPEIILKFFDRHKVYGETIPVVIGDARVLEFYKNLYLFKELQIKAFKDWKDIEKYPPDRNFEKKILVWDIGSIDIQNLIPGESSKECGIAAYKYIINAIDLALAGKVVANVTAPICKHSLHEAGYSFPGHTEIYAQKTGTQRYMMALFTSTLKVAHLTCHMALKDVFSYITASNIQWACMLLHETMQKMGVFSPKIGVCALNPHASENGVFGQEEEEIIIPALKILREQKIRVYGPIPADTIFARAKYGQFDIILSLYHDQGHIAVKTLHFEKTAEYFAFSGVNVTLGLPIIRTSVDHGTAFDITGKNQASEQSLYEAYLLALNMFSGEK